jgi:hypothetical protein
MTDRRAAAYHEAGHVIARLTHGLTFDRAYICADGTGLVEIGLGPRGEPFGGAVRALAGPIAEWVLSDYQTPLGQILNDQAKTDFEHARAALAVIGADQKFGEAVDIAHQLITWAWPGVVAIAGVLAAEGDIGCDAAVALVNAVLADISPTSASLKRG